MLTIYSFVFTVVFKVRWGQETGEKGQYAVILFSGLMLHGFLTETLSRAPVVVTQNPNFVKKVVFPLEILVPAMIGSALFHLAISLGVLLFAYLAVYHTLQWTLVFLPLVVLPHGGPIGVFDEGSYSREPQMLAAAGYAVLQVNFRGSANYGRAFTQAGAKQWGAAMQDDVTDATRWAIAQGHAEASRICIYGASYGGYASLMGVAKEPGLYKCAVGQVGVYDLNRMRSDDSLGNDYLRHYHEKVMNTGDLAAVSPTRLADRIKVPVFITSGHLDERLPIAQSETMEAALKKAGVPVETLYFKTEGHGIYKREHRAEFYARLLTFLQRNIGGRAPVPVAGAGVD